MKRNVSQPPSKKIFLSSHQRVREGILIFFSLLAIYLLLALSTYQPDDPGWSTTGEGGFIQNAGGRVGAWVADVLFYAFGYLAYALPVFFACLAGWVFQLSEDNKLSRWFSLFLRILGAFLSTAAGSVLLYRYFSAYSTSLPMGMSGVLGRALYPEMLRGLNAVGASLVAIAGFLAGVTLFIGISWLFIAEFFGKILLRLGRAVKKYYSESASLAETGVRHAADFPNLALDSDIGDPLSVHTKVSLPTTFYEQQELPLGLPKREKAKAKPKKNLSRSDLVPAGDFPSLDLLDPPKPGQQQYTREDLENLSAQVERCLADFDIKASVVGVYPGPIIVRFELDLSPGQKVSKITPLAKDFARALSVNRVRVVEVIPGKSVIGLEIPNKYREVVSLREVFDSSAYQDPQSILTLALGKDISGKPYFIDLVKMPHLLAAGTTGSGKSVSLNAMLLSLLYRLTPEEVRFIMIDPKMLELSIYDGIPHLLAPVVIDVKEAAGALRWCVAEMERRYRLMAALGVRNLAGFNQKIKAAIQAGKPLFDPLAPKGAVSEEPKLLEPLPYLVVIVDELADMMMVVGKKVEELITRIAQKARAAGVHLILATQRPSVDVITGLIKANVPARIAFQVSSRIDSRTILDQQGAEQLLGYGDMLYLPAGTAHPVRIHGAFVSDEEVHRVVADWKARGEPQYIEGIVGNGEEVSSNGFNGLNGFGESEGGEQDALYDQAVAIVTDSKRASISYVQRRLKIGYNRAARILEEMENAGVVSSMNSQGVREVLVGGPPED